MLSRLKFNNGVLDAQRVVYYTRPEENRYTRDDQVYVFHRYKIYTDTLIFNINTGESMIGDLAEHNDWVNADFTSMEHFLKHRPIGDGAWIGFMVEGIETI